ncbi:MAG: helicase SNF2 [Rhodoferax sp.]|nr:helicase SNF2 [Rhodoferax sp.]
MNTGKLWFEPLTLQRLTDAATWTRGLATYRNQQVLDLEIEAGPDHWLLVGGVQGSARQPYDLEVEIALSPAGEVLRWDSQCSCPVARRCKHAVALALKAAYQGRALLGPLAGRNPDPAGSAPSLEAAHQAARAQAEALARMRAEQQLLEWLAALDRSDAAEAPATSPRPVQLLYLLSVANPQGPAPQLQFEISSAQRKQDGAWGKPRALRTLPLPGQAVLEAATPDDLEVLQLVRAMPSSSSLYGSFVMSPSVRPAGQAGRMLLQLAARTGRLYTQDGHGLPVAPVQWGEALPLEWHWQPVPGPAGADPGWALRARLARASGPQESPVGGTAARLCLNEPPLYLDSARGLCGPVTTAGLSDAQINALLKGPALKTLALRKHQAELAQRLGRVPLPPVLEPLVPLRGLAPQACLHLWPTAPGWVASRGLLQARLVFDYDGHRGWWVGQGGSVVVEDARGRFLLERDSLAELEAIDRLLALGLVAGDGGAFGLPGRLPQRTWLDWADTDFAALRAAGFEVTTDPALAHWITRTGALQVDLSAEGAHPDATDSEVATSPWFSLSLGLEINGQRHNILPWLPQLIASLSGEGAGDPTLPEQLYLPRPEGGFLRLSSAGLQPWLSMLLELAGERGQDLSGDRLRLSRLEALRATAALGEGASWTGAASLQRVVQQLGGRGILPAVPPPAGLQATLRPYQQQGLNWLQFLRTQGLGGILADDMGLGKTLQTLAHLLLEQEAGRLDRPALVLAPVSLLGNWQREAARFGPSLRCLVLHGQQRHEAADRVAEADLVIAPYSLLQRDRERWLGQEWHLVVLDEAQNIKNASTQAAQVVAGLRARHRLCLSGTPMENHLGELWSLFHFLMPGFLGSQQRFREQFRTPIEKQGDAQRLAQLRARVTPFMLRRTKDQVAPELPPKVETVMTVQLTGAQADLYETIRLGMEHSVREALAQRGLARSQITILDALLKLRQVCCDPRLLPLAAASRVRTSAKLAQLMDLLPDMLAEGRRVLLFSQFTSMLSLIEEELTERGLPWVKLTGQSRGRDALIERFTSGGVPLFLISLKAGGTGLNLPQADTVIHYDPWWNPAVEAQASDRAHRIGQTRSVWNIKLVAQGTIEERILALQTRKAGLAEGLYGGTAARREPLFTEDDLAELLKPLSNL